MEKRMRIKKDNKESAYIYVSYIFVILSSTMTLHFLFYVGNLLFHLQLSLYIWRFIFLTLYTLLLYIPKFSCLFARYGTADLCGMHIIPQTSSWFYINELLTMTQSFCCRTFSDSF